ncbi:MAG TPA: 3-oxoacyl-ACP reductase FabG [Dehalococcoidia bacterium]|nr:3-oxoacyl-ACP reductase FabG [Dehalococcoidia bacterium]
MGILENKVAIVTGGAKGLGKAYSLRMAEEGAKVVVADILEEDAEAVAKEIKAKGGKAIAVKADVTSEAETKGMAEKTVQEFGRIDILVNNAGFYHGMSRKSFDEISPAEWDKMMDVSAKGTWLCSRAVFPQMKKQNKGKIINISSEAVFAPTKGLIHYTAAKAAVIGISRVLAGELGQYNICVNVVVPGVIDTPATRSYVNMEKMDASSVPMGRFGKPEDVVGAVIFFASDDSDFVSGQTLLVDGARRVN